MYYTLHMSISSSLSDTAKYQYEEDGLRINNINPSDNGTYECRAEVDSQGNLKIRLITLGILCEQTSSVKLFMQFYSIQPCL